MGDVPEKEAAPHTLLFIDDEENILNALRRVFRKEPYRILTTTHAQEGLDWVASQPVALVISDHRMPEMLGTTFLTRVRELKPGLVRIILTGYAEMKAAVEAINACQVYRFIAKPWNDDDLRLTVREALRQYDLEILNRELTGLVKQQNQELFDMNRTLEEKVRERTRELEEKNGELSHLYRKLETGFLDAVHAFMGLMELKSPFLVGHGRRVASLAKEVSACLGLPEEDQRLCELGGLLMDIGTIGYPDSLLKKKSEELDGIELALWEKHPLLGEESLKKIERLRPVSRVVRSHHERFNGRGFPDGLRAEQIPISARIIAAVDCFNLLVNPPDPTNHLSVSLATGWLQKEMGSRFDPAVVHALISLVAKVKGEEKETILSNEVEISLDELKEGMILAKDLKTRGGILLLPAGNMVQKVHLEKIHNFHRIDPIVDRIGVFRPVRDHH